MSLLFERLLPYLAVAVFVFGTGSRLLGWLRVPVPFPLTLFPAPSTPTGRIASVAAEVVPGRTLLRQNRALWGWWVLLHASLVLILLGHLIGISALRTQFSVLGLRDDASRAISHALGWLAGLALLASLAGLAWRRYRDRLVRLLTWPGQWFELALLAAIAASGLAMSLPGLGVDLSAVRQYLGGLLTGRFAPLPHDAVFGVHLVLAELLLIYFPFSRMLHAVGIFVTRAILVEAPPQFPTPDGTPPRSPLASRMGVPR